MFSVLPVLYTYNTTTVYQSSSTRARKEAQKMRMVGGFFFTALKSDNAPGTRVYYCAHLCKPPSYF